MKILHVTSHLNIGGVTRSVLSLSEALAARGHRVLVAADGGALAAQLPVLGLTHWPVPLHTSAEFSPRVFSAFRRLSAQLAGEPVDIIHAHTRVGQVVAARLSRAARIPYVATWHGFFRPNLGRRLWPCAGDRTIAISEPVRQHLIRVLRVPEARIRLIPHGIDPTPFERPVDPAAQERLRVQAHLPQTGPVIGTIARLVASKGVDQLIRSLPLMRRSLPQLRLLIIGDGPARPALERLAGAIGVAEAVHFAGALPDTRAALSLMDVFVFLPAEEEGFGLSLLDAMASARPIVAVRRGGGASWVLDQVDVGTQVAPENAQALADAVVRYLQNGEAACRAAGQARAVVKERYSVARMVDQVEAVYGELVSTSVVRSP